MSHVSQPNYTHTPSDVLLSGWNPYLIGELSITSMRLVTIQSSQAQKSLFKVHQSVLCDKSAFFKTMFNAHHEANLSATDGQSNANLIILPDQVMEAAFELFLSVCYNK